MGHKYVSIFKTQLECFCAQLLHSSTFEHSYCQLSVHQRAARQQLSENVLKLSFEYLHIYSHKVMIFAEKNSKIASLMYCQRSDLRKH